MTTEDDFQRHLDQFPDDWQTRLVFADFLQERGDIRAEGYRAMGQLRLYAHKRNPDMATDLGAFGWFCKGYVQTEPECHKLPREWSKALRLHVGFRSRKEAEDRAAEVFQAIAPQQRITLLNSLPV